MASQFECESERCHWACPCLTDHNHPLYPDCVHLTPSQECPHLLWQAYETWSKGSWGAEMWGVPETSPCSCRERLSWRNEWSCPHPNPLPEQVADYSLDWVCYAIENHWSRDVYCVCIRDEQNYYQRYSLIPACKWPPLWLANLSACKMSSKASAKFMKNLTFKC